MPRIKHTLEEIVVSLRHVDVIVSQCVAIAEAIHQIDLTRVTYRRRHQEYGGLNLEQIKPQTELALEDVKVR